MATFEEKYPMTGLHDDRVTRQVSTFDLDKRSKVKDVPRGEKVTLAEAQGSGVLTQLWLTFPGWFWQWWAPESPINPSILKTLILRIYWDGASAPAVECPVGDFFGVGLCEAGNFANRYFGMTSGGFFCKFPMPFRRGFRIEVENQDEEIDTCVFLNALYQEETDIPENSGWFHSHFLTGRKAGQEPTPVAQVEGKGHFMGCSLSMQGINRGTMFFLEAPEYIYMDEDWERPRITGTGLEDYFLGGWYFREGCFQGPLHGVPVKDPLNASIAMHRLHEADAIHFQKRFKMEFVNPFDPEKLTEYAFASTSYFYLDRPEGQNPPLPDREKLLCWYRLRDRDHQSIP